jgi:hypothetical protein
MGSAKTLTAVRPMVRPDRRVRLEASGTAAPAS